MKGKELRNLIIVVIAVITICVVGIYVEGFLIQKRLDNAILMCQNVMDSLAEDNLKVNEPILEKYMQELHSSEDTVSLNLTEYFKGIIDETAYIEEIRREKSDSTPEEQDRIRQNLLYKDGVFIEDEHIYVEDDVKYIKVKDLHFLDNGDAIIKYYDGEYVIDKNSIPQTYTMKRENGYYTYRMKSVEKKPEGSENLYVFHCNGIVIELAPSGILNWHVTAMYEE